MFNKKPKMPMKTIRLFSSSKPKVKKVSRTNMTYRQAKKRYPSLNPFGDKDKDGVINMEDCKPFNRRKQDEGNTEEANAEFQRQKEARRKFKEAEEAGEPAYKHKTGRRISGRGVSFEDIF